MSKLFCVIFLLQFVTGCATNASSSPKAEQPKLELTGVSEVAGITPVKQVDQVVKAQWSRITKALLVGDKQTAMTYLTDDAKLKYGPVFDALIPNFAQILPTWSPLLYSNISAHWAEYIVVTDDGTKRQLFNVNFRLDDDGVWRLESM
jgi:hypothetical protein